MRRTILLSFLSIIWCTTIYAQTKSSKIESDNSGKYYIHTVQAKETFYGLSKLYGVSIDDIKQSNNNLEALSIGQDIRIPVLESAEESKYDDGQLIVKNGQSFLVHNVQPGETIYALARTYNTSAGQIINANPSISNSQISIGQQLFIPFSGTVNQPQPKVETIKQETATTDLNKNAHIGTITFVDELGIEDISKETHVPIEVIRNLNPEIPNKIEPGHEITIPLNVTYLTKEFYFCSSENTSLSEIAEKYHVTTKDLLHYNSYGIVHFDEGSFILVPINNENKNFAQDQINEHKFVYHVVQQGETQYSIAHKYHVEESLLVANNIKIDMMNMATGCVLRIPYQDYFYEYIPQQTTQTEYTQNLDIKRQNIHATLLLPFFLDRNNQQNEDGIINKPKEIYEHTYQFLEYYEGALLALDSLKKLGLNITLDVIESNNDSASTNINKIKTTTNLIIGPVFPKTFPAAAAFAKRRSIPIISPLSTEETNSLNPFVVQMNTPQKYRFKAMADHIITNNENCHVCIIYNSESLEKKNVNLCKAAFTELKSKMDSKHITIEELFYPSAGSAGMERAMSKKEKTIFIVLSKQQAFANNIVTKIYQSSKTHTIELWGMPQWELYENLELDFLFDLNFKLVTSGEVDYTSPLVNQFITIYREKYNTEPTKFSFQGFDQMLFFIKHYATSNDFFVELPAIEDKDGLYDDFNFYRKDGSTVNTSCFIIEYDKSTFTRKKTPYIQNK